MPRQDNDLSIDLIGDVKALGIFGDAFGIKLTGRPGG